MIEDEEALRKLCYLLQKRFQYELAFKRAQYRVSYYRKQLNKLNSSKHTAESKNKLQELTGKIETSRLVALKKQKDLIKAKQSLNGSISKMLVKMRAHLINSSGVAAVQINFYDDIYSKPQYVVNANKIAEYASEYEANQILDKVLKQTKE